MQDDDSLVGQLRVLQPKTVGMARQLPTLRMLDRSRRLHHGWLLKEGGVLRTQWKRRWCVLQPEGMYYFRAEGRNEDQIPNEDEPARGLIPILGASVRVLQTDFHFEVTTARRTYLFRVDREYHNAEQRRAYDAQARGGVAPVTAPPLGGDLLRSRESSLAVPDVAEGVASGAGAGANGLAPRIGGGIYSSSGVEAIARAAASFGGAVSGTDTVAVVGGAVVGGGSSGGSFGGGGGSIGGATLAGSALEGESAGSYGKDLAEWIAALQRANLAVPKEEGRHHIKRVHMLNTRNADGLLQQVGRKQREHLELVSSPAQRARTSMKGGWQEDGDMFLRMYESGAGGVRVRRMLSSSLAAEAAAALSAAVGAQPKPPPVPTVAGDWLYRYFEQSSQWRRLWCTMQGRTLLCYAETFTEEPSVVVGPLVPDGIDLERPALVLWPSDVPIQPSSDNVGAPSKFVFTLTSAVCARRHRLCAESREKMREWIEALQAATTTPGRDGRVRVGSFPATDASADRAAAAAAALAIADAASSSGRCSGAAASSAVPSNPSSGGGAVPSGGSAVPSGGESASAVPSAEAGAEPSKLGFGSAPLGTALPPLGTALPEKQRALLKQRTKARREREHDDSEADDAGFQSADDGMLVSPRESADYESDGTSGEVAALGRSNTTLGRRSNSSWREAAGREYGSDGYRFGDGTRLAVRKLTETIVKPY
jgi:hypothetical protein